MSTTLGRCFGASLFACLLASLALWFAPPAQGAVTQAKSAYGFTESVGVNVHASYFDTSYGPRWDNMALKLAQAGIHHARDGAVWADGDATFNDIIYDRFATLSGGGTKLQLIFEPASAQRVRDVLAKCGSSCESVEGPNEKDSNDPAFQRQWQTTLYDTVGSIRPNMPIGAPTYIDCGTYGRHGNYEGVSDFGNFHPYPGGRNPETAGWGAGGYGSISYNLACVRPQSPTQPIMATESGYYTLPKVGDGVPEDVAGIYAPRLFLWNYANGIERTYWYEALDQCASTHNPECNFGLLHRDGTPKPAYTAIKNTQAIMADPAGAGFTPGSLDYTITGDVNGVRHVLFQKSNGQFVLAVWNDALLYDVNRDTRLGAANKSVTIKFAHPMRMIRIYKPNVQVTPQKTFKNRAHISQSISPQVKLYVVTR